ncbi:hypothetical protein PINS_up015439 [Pythium insidiosum]|nr:hypothetical protein PINS_up015439 [Pythium insidiosum]
MTACAKALVKHGADPSLRDVYGDSMLECARGHKGKTREKLLRVMAERAPDRR